MSTGPKQSVPTPAFVTATREGKAQAFVDSYGEAFGVHGHSQLRVLTSHGPGAVGMEHVRFQQRHDRDDRK